MRPSGWLGAILVLLITLIAGGVGFAIGTTTTLPEATTGTAGFVPGAWGWHPVGWGFPFFPLFGLLLVFLLIATLVGIGRRAAWAGRHGYGGYGWGAGPFGPGDPRRAAFDDWHRRAHEQAPSSPWQDRPGGTPPSGQQPPSGTDPTAIR